jgi:hypothetical protein
VTLHRRKKKSRVMTLAAQQTKARKATKRLRPEPSRAVAPIFWPDHYDEVKAIAMTGMANDDMARALGVKEELWDAWTKYYPGFAKAIEDGRTNADAQVVAALHKNAIGFKYTADEVVRTRRGAQVVQVEKHFLPETGAQKFWLTNRKPEWRAAQNMQVGGQKGAPIGVEVKQETKMMVIHSILNLIRPQPDN